MAIDHTNCTHPRTPAGRRVCRDAARVRDVHQAMEPQVSSIQEAIAYVIANPDKAVAAATAKAEAWIASSGTDKARARVAARKRSQRPARIQPRRSGARVSIDNSGCVQAALHTDAHGGRCACGWAAEKAA